MGLDVFDLDLFGIAVIAAVRIRRAYNVALTYIALQ